MTELSCTKMLKVATIYFVSLWLYCHTIQLIDEDEIVPCLTPNSTQGYCVNLEMCDVLYDTGTDDKIVLNLERWRYIQKSGCGFNGSVAKVCCPLVEPTMAFFPSDLSGFGTEPNSETRDCLTPNATRGECIELQDCPAIYSVSTDFTTPLTLETAHYLINSMCGFNGTNPKVCCPLVEPVVVETTKNSDLGNDCVTSNATKGECIELESCPSMSADFTAPLTLIDFIYLRDSLCVFDRTNPIVCCPLAPVETTENLDCLTPNATKGECIELQECPSIYSVSTDFITPLTIETFIYLRDSMCGFNGTNPKVCCPIGTAPNDV